MSLFDRLRRQWGCEWLRFLVAGAVNTVASLALYWGLLLVTSYVVAYSVSFAAGILLSFLLNSRFVFRVALTVRKLLLFPLVYGVQYAVGLLVLWTWTDLLRLPASVGILMSIAVTVPITFLLIRAVLK